MSGNIVVGDSYSTHGQRAWAYNLAGNPPAMVTWAPWAAQKVGRRP